MLLLDINELDEDDRRFDEEFVLLLFESFRLLIFFVELGRKRVIVQADSVKSASKASFKRCSGAIVSWYAAMPSVLLEPGFFY